ncbi:MAG TPA: putative baseplate assembly protein [Terriglobales bacterium]|nr:putative baseplate assembly protein [Terriglobales bacterium]
MIYSCCNENRKNAVLNSPNAIISTPTVDAAGSGYAVGDVLTVAQSGSSGTATVTVASISASGGITGVSLSLNGTNYSTATGVPTSGGKGSGCTLNITGTPNGIDYLEVSSDQQTLMIHCLTLAPATLTPDNVMITGGESITGIAAQSVSASANVLTVSTNKSGDFSAYTLRLVNKVTQAEQDPFEITEVLAGFDPQLADVQFSFKVECGPDFDCNPQPPSCASSTAIPPPINYLAKDYGSFRTIILDRLSQLLPDWAGNSEADLGVVLAELMAYVGDYMSYRQDAIATEAYLETARSRVSLRRHAFLVDYHVHDGCNARVWVCFQVAGTPGQAIFLDRSATVLCTNPPTTSNLVANSGNVEAALLAGAQFFEPMQDALLYPEHNQMSFYTWGDSNCCLPQGSTEATLAGSYPNLQPGDVLIFQEVIGPQTANSADADIRHRCAVRLSQVATKDAGGSALVDRLFDATGNPILSPAQTPALVTEIQWSQDDALPFPLCISSMYLVSSGQQQSAQNVSVAFGNVVMADHGLSFTAKSLKTVPGPWLFYPAQPEADRCQIQSPVPLPVRYRPQIPDSPLTQAVPVAVTPLAGAGIPLTPTVVSLGASGLVALPNAYGFASLTLKTTNPAGWPSLFGMGVRANTTNPANLDLSVVYNPPGGAAGIEKQIVVETFSNLSLNSADSNYVVTQINSNSELILVQSASAAALSGFPAAPVMLSNNGPVNLQDVSNPPVTYLTAQAANPGGWLQLFGVLTKPNANPEYFDLDVVYDPPSGGVGVTLPVTLESFASLSPGTAAVEINAGSALVNVDSFAQVPDPSLSAYDLMNFDPGEAVPVVSLTGTVDGATTTWTPQQDLLESGESDPVFVVEVESDGTATLRFGDGTNGKSPEQDTAFVVNYRIGNGSSGNVGAQSLVLQVAGPGIESVTNPLPAVGGTDPETNDQIRRRAPQAFLTQDRAVTMADYENVTEENPQVDQAVATLRWTGSWYTVFIAAEPQEGGTLTPALQAALKGNAERYRLAGQDLELESPQYVSLEIELQVCVDPNYFQGDVEQSLLAVLGNQILPNGQKGLFYPDNFTFGQTVYLSRVYAAVQPVAGVVSVVATKFQLQGVNTTQYLNAGEISLGSLQVARLDNDPNYPNHGQLTLVMEGGK